MMNEQRNKQSYWTNTKESNYDKLKQWLNQWQMKNEQKNDKTTWYLLFHSILPHNATTDTSQIRCIDLSCSIEIFFCCIWHRRICANRHRMNRKKFWLGERIIKTQTKHKVIHNETERRRRFGRITSVCLIQTKTKIIFIKN